MPNRLNIPERTEKYKQGLIDMINYIDQISPTKDMKIIEVGCWTGCGSEIFAKRFKSVVCIDKWQQNGGDHLTRKYLMSNVELMFDERAEKYKNIFKSKMSSLEAAKVYSDMTNEVLPEVVYIDAMHDYENVIKDLIAWKDIPSKFICGHDYERRFIGVVKAVREVFGKPQAVFKDSSWAIKLPGKDKE